MEERKTKERKDRVRIVTGNKSKRVVEIIKRSLKAQKFRRENDLKERQDKQRS